MPISEAQRTDLYNGLRDVLGPENTEILMSVLRLHDLDQLATKQDLAELRAELKNDISGVRIEMANLRADLTNEIDTFRKSMTSWVLMLVVANIGAVVSVALIV